MRYPLNYIVVTNYPHQGRSIDFGWYSLIHRGQPIYACDDGIVMRKEVQEYGGNVIYIKHPSNIVSCYAHLNKMLVNVNDQVKKGQQIATMGDTGIHPVTKKRVAMHLHFGLYAPGENIYGDASLDPFLYLKLDKDQVMHPKTLKEYGSKIQSISSWLPGRYELLISKAIRKDHVLTNNIVKVNNIMASKKKLLTSSNKASDAYYKVGTILDIKEIYQDETGRIWGRTINTWVVLCNKDGTPQAKYLDN